MGRDTPQQFQAWFKVCISQPFDFKGLGGAGIAIKQALILQIHKLSLKLR